MNTLYWNARYILNLYAYQPFDQMLKITLNPTMIVIVIEYDD
jgi:hypothetical protein